MRSAESGASPLCHLRCRAGLRYGWGHLVRSTTLGAYMRRNGWRVGMAVEAEPAARAFLDHRGFADALVLDRDDAPEARRLEGDPPAVVIVDMLEPPRDLLLRYRRTGAKVMAFSDTGIALEGADLVVCPNPKEVWAAADGRMVGGLGYVIVAPEVAAVARTRGPAPERARRLFVNMGGSISRVVFTAIVQVLDRLRRLGFEGVFLLGYDRDFEIDAELRRELHPFELVEGRDDIAPLLADADLALTAAGYMRYEVAAAGLPAVLVSLVEHQHRFGRMFADAGIASYAGPILDADPADVVAEIVRLAEDRDLRTRLGATGCGLVDGQATGRIAEAARRLAGLGGAAFSQDPR